MHISRAFHYQGIGPSIAQALYWLLRQACALPPEQLPKSAETVKSTWATDREDAVASQKEGDKKRRDQQDESRDRRAVKRVASGPGALGLDASQPNAISMSTSFQTPLPRAALQIFQPLGTGLTGVVYDAR